MPLSSAERCRKYREKLRKENPDKFEAMKKKNAERTKAKKRKISDMTENEQAETRQQWRDAKRKKMKNKEEPEVLLAEKAKSEVESAARGRRRYRSQVTRENLKLKEKIRDLNRRNENLRKALARSKTKICALTAELNDIKLVQTQKLTQLHPYHDQNTSPKLIQETNVIQKTNELTPLTKSNSFVEEELKEISKEAKEKIKQKLLQHHVLEESLKETYKQSKPFQERNLLKKIVESDTVKKYKMKENITKCFGLKSCIRPRNTMKQKKLKTILELRKFFERDDVSRMTAGKKEYVTHKKIQKQKRYLLNTLIKLYSKYRSEGGRLSFTTFKRYRPFYVISPKITNRNTCACVKHANLAFKAESLKKLGLIRSTDPSDLVSEIVCDIKSKNCMYSECEICSDKRFDLDVSDADGQDVSWFEWRTKTHEYDKNDEHKVTKRTVKVLQTGHLSTLTQLLQDELQKFKVHHFNIYHQYKEYKRAIESVRDDEVILHCDFSENYVCKMAEEIQSMHFGASKRQVTLHTGVIYIKNEKTICFATISPSLKHSPEAIWGHLKPVIDFIKNKYPGIDRLHVWSDGPTTQYRQKNNFYLFCQKSKEAGFVHATWSFFEASHGKGAADGVGGVIKRTLDARVTYGDDIIDAKTAFDVLSKTETSVKTFFVSEQDIENIEIPNDVKILAIPSTMKIHQVIATENKEVIKYRSLSCFCTRGNCDCFSTQTHVLTKTKSKEKKQSNNKKITKTSKKYSNSSSEDTDIDIQYAESDDSYMTENSNDENLEGLGKREKETAKGFKLNKSMQVKTGSHVRNEKEVNKDAGRKESMVTQTLDNTERKIITHDPMIKETKKEHNDKEIKILAEIRNTPENRSYFDLKRLPKMSLKKIGLDFDLCSAKESTERKNLIDTNPIPSATVPEINKELCVFNEDDSAEAIQQNDLDDYIKVNDFVLVRYYIRKIWKYYAGFVEKISTKDDETLYTVRFLKAMKTPELKFVLPKKKDIDDITTLSIVKKIRLSQQMTGEYCLVDDFDNVYFN